MQSSFKTTSLLGLATLAALGLAAAQPALAQSPTDTIAYAVDPGTAGNQGWTGSLGLDFNVGASSIYVSQLGAFAPGGSGSYTFATDKTVSVYDRNTQNAVATLVFTHGTSYTLTGGSAFQSLPTLLTLPAGFEGTIVASGYNNSEQNFNAGFLSPSVNANTTENSGNGLISFVGSSRYANSGDTSYPTIVDRNPNDRYDAGTFSFHSATVAPEPSAFAPFAFAALGLGALVLRAKKRNSAAL